MHALYLFIYISEVTLLFLFSSIKLNLALFVEIENYLSILLLIQPLWFLLYFKIKTLHFYNSSVD